MGARIAAAPAPADLDLSVLDILGRSRLATPLSA
jgi:hypothetical protein